MHDLQWDDWGRPQRIVDSLARIGRKPAFPRLPEAEPVPQPGFPPGLPGLQDGFGM